MKYEVIMGAYNDPTVLRATLEGYLRQIDREFSICVADDGSGPEVKLVVDDFALKGLNIRHVWHKDDGFRKTIILNKAINSSNADRIIFTDSDCIPHKLFVKDHKSMAKEKTIITGPRVLLREEITEKIKNEELDISYLNNTLRLLFQSIVKKVSKPEQAFYFPERWLGHLQKIKKVWPYGANMSMDKKDILDVNGFDEDFLGWGGEDINIVDRLKNNGLSQYGSVGRAIVYHLEHPIRSAHDGNDSYKETKLNKERNETFCKNGIYKN